MRGDREKTEAALLDAVSALVAEGGFGALGVNAVADRAGVSKVLIYRYFGGLDALAERWALERAFWPGAAEALEKKAETGALTRQAAAAAAKGILAEALKAFRADPLARELVRGFVVGAPGLPASAMARVEERGRVLAREVEALLRRAEPPFPALPDLEAAEALLIGGIYYLVLIADRTPVFNGISLADESGWARVEAALDRLLDGLLRQASN